MFWDSGTELNEAPGMGPNQAPRQPALDTGPTEGGVYLFTNTTRSLPISNGVGTVSVTEAGGTYTVTVQNTSAERGAIDTPLSPLFWAIHDATWQLFTPGSPDYGDGLEALAEDGIPDELVATYTGAPGTAAVGAAGSAPILTGDQIQFTVTPHASHPYLTLATMVVDSNDVFLAFGPGGVALLDSDGLPRPDDEINADMARYLAAWDAGTEANEVPGVGPNQAPNQPAPNTGPSDPNNLVRVYADPTNDLAASMLGGFTNLTIVHSSDTTFDLTLTNTSDTTVYPGMLTPLVWAIHDETASLFEVGMPASPGLESVAEDGDPALLADEVAALPGVISSGISDQPDGGPPGPLMPGQSYTATLTLDAGHRYLSLASMVVPSNDMFMAFHSEGIALLNEDGTPRSDDEIAADIATLLTAWDSGTERNQAGAAGFNQAPVQPAPNTGADEGNGLVRLLGDPDPVWSYPDVSAVVRVTISGEPAAVSLSDLDSTAPSANPLLILAASAGLIAALGIAIRRRRKA
ncbi:MAG: spondin domain-containing protein, partial [Ardenticatenaceae bacterium]